MKAIQHSQETIDGVIKDYLSEVILQKDILAKYNINEWGMYRILELNGIPRTRTVKRHQMNRKYHYNQKLFGEINTEHDAYFLGILMSDGWVEDEYQTRMVGLTMCDEEVIKNWKEYVNTDKPIKVLHPKNRKVAYNLSLYSTEIVNNLKQWGVVPLKTKRTHIPNINYDLIRHFIRGYLDGDGGIDHQNRTHVIRFASSSHKVLLEIEAHFIAMGLIRDKNYISKMKNQDCSNLRVCNKKEFMKVCEYLYKDATIYMTRKYNNFLEAKKVIEIGRLKLPNCSSKYFGVHYMKVAYKKNWGARIKHNKQSISAGNFYTELDAARAYNDKILELGLDRPLNVIDESPQLDTTVNQDNLVQVT